MATRQAYFYNSSGGDKKYNADSMIDWLTPFFTTGVFNNNFRVVANGAMQVTIEGGYCNIQGRVMHQWDDDALDVPVASGNLSRIDIAIIRRDDVTRDIYPLIISGGFSDTPTRPALTRENGIYDIQLAEWVVKPGVIAINQVDITDTRMDSDLCGWVVGTVPQVDFSQIYAQFTEFFAEYKDRIMNEYTDYTGKLNNTYEDFAALTQKLTDNSNTNYNDLVQWFADFKTQSESDYTAWFNTTTAQNQQDFEDWFQTIQDMLSGDVATEFANDILALQQDIATINTSIDTANTDISGLLAQLTALSDRLFSSACLGASYLGNSYLGG